MHKHIAMKTNHLNTNKQFMIGNGILAFAVIFVIVLFTYLSLTLQKNKKSTKYAEVYSIELSKGFAGDSISVYINDSILLKKRITKEPQLLQVNRFAEESVLMIVDNKTDKATTFNLKKESGVYQFTKEGNEIKSGL
jgi:hypothetical protein